MVAAFGRCEDRGAGGVSHRSHTAGSHADQIWNKETDSNQGLTLYATLNQPEAYPFSATVYLHLAGDVDREPNSLIVNSIYWLSLCPGKLTICMYGEEFIKIFPIFWEFQKNISFFVFRVYFNYISPFPSSSCSHMPPSLLSFQFMASLFINNYYCLHIHICIYVRLVPDITYWLHTMLSILFYLWIQLASFYISLLLLSYWIFMSINWGKKFRTKLSDLPSQMTSVLDGMLITVRTQTYLRFPHEHGNLRHREEVK